MLLNLIAIYLRIDKYYTMLLKITNLFSQLASYGHIVKILPIRKLATKRDTLFLTNKTVSHKHVV